VEKCGASIQVQLETLEELRNSGTITSGLPLTSRGRGGRASDSRSTFPEGKRRDPRYCLISPPLPLSLLSPRYNRELFQTRTSSSDLRLSRALTSPVSSVRGIQKRAEESCGGKFTRKPRSRGTRGRRDEVRREKSGRERESEERAIASFTRGMRCKCERKRVHLSLARTFIVIAVARSLHDCRLFISSGTAIRAHTLAI